MAIYLKLLTINLKDEKTQSKKMNNMKKTHITILFLLICSGSYGQLNPLATQYFNNRYLGNPAHAGMGDGLNINMNYRRQWTNVPGSPELQNLALDYGMKKAGLGLNINLDRAGLQRQTRVVGSYAYHLPLNKAGHELSFGVSLGYMDQRLSSADISGNPNDPLAMRYNDREGYVDGDFGVAYTTGRFNLEASLPNLNFLFKRSVLRTADIPTFYTAVSYRLALTGGLEDVGIEPRLAYRGVKGFDNVLDLGANVSFANQQVMLMGMYHSSKSASFGIGVDLKKRYLVSGAYTTQTSQLSNYTNGSFEISLKLRVGK